VTVDQINLTGGDHAVHFYRADDELADRAAAYLEGALRAGGVAIAIATAPHLGAVRDKLADLGVEAQTAIKAGRLILLDAHATLAKLMIEGRVDRASFDRVIGSTVRAAGERSSAVRAYGEMVDVLWQDGDIPGAIELERLWNELLAGVRFTLLCAYRSEAVAAPEQDGSLTAVCQLHSSVSREFKPDDHAPIAARRFLEDALRRWGHGEAVVEDARLLISELVTNAVIHARSVFSVSIASWQRKLRLEVHDRSLAIPTAVRRSPDAQRGGRGLQIVAALADDWGVVRTPHGKTVWAELSQR
jgi:anti-sigma regulatory factor (Ser/Thr protein kinase)